MVKALGSVKNMNVEFGKINESLLVIRNLKTYFFMDEGILKAVDGINLDIKKGETLGLVGESGSGKSVTALSIMRLIQKPGRIVAGEILLKDQDLLKKKEKEIRNIRGKDISIIFQDPTAALNPVMKVGDQIAEVLKLKQKMSSKDATQKAVEMMESVIIPEAGIRSKEYPHQLSGGMKQRVMIAIALACQPELLIADEPTTNLDVTVEVQILELIRDMKRKINSSLLYITHDLGVIAEVSDKVSVMYSGKIMESTLVDDLFNSPGHPYTQALIQSFPTIGTKELNIIPGSVPDPIDPPSGCRFHPRCIRKKSICLKMEPKLAKVGNEHYVACHYS